MKVILKITSIMALANLSKKIKCMKGIESGEKRKGIKFSFNCAKIWANGLETK